MSSRKSRVLGCNSGPAFTFSTQQVGPSFALFSGFSYTAKKDGFCQSQLISPSQRRQRSSQHASPRAGLPAPLLSEPACRELAGEPRPQGRLHAQSRQGEAPHPAKGIGLPRKGELSFLKQSVGRSQRMLTNSPNAAK